jgi:hypothetical protein
MHIYFRGDVAQKFPGFSYGTLPAPDKWRTPFLLVMHSSDVSKVLADEGTYRKDKLSQSFYSTLSSLEQGNYVLAVSTSPMAGIRKLEQVQELEKQYDNRLHCLRCSCPVGGTESLNRRAKHFFAEVERLKPGKSIPWHLIEDREARNITAIYLILAAYQSSPALRKQICEAWNSAKQEWGAAVLEKAREEFLALGEGTAAWHKIMDNFIDLDFNAAEAIRLLRAVVNER